MTYDTFQCARVSPEDMDRLWSLGFRHFGAFFFRYDVVTHESGRIQQVIPLRINLDRFEYSKSQKRILKRTRDLTILFRPSYIDREKIVLFEKHKQRFHENIPESLYDFMSPSPSKIPCDNIECCVYDNDKLMAVGFMDVGKKAASCVYTMFDTAYSKRSLGILMILNQVRYSLQKEMSYLYHGYAYREPSFYDYKKNFHGLECFDWKGNWNPA